MECNRDEALRAREIAEKKFNAKDIAGAKKFALKAQTLFPELEGISRMVATLDVHLAAEECLDEDKNWYGILGVSSVADDDMVKKQYRKLALMLHPDKNKSIGADVAFNLVSEAWKVLSDKARRSAYDQKRHVLMTLRRVNRSRVPSNGHNFVNDTSSNPNPPKSTACTASTCPPQTGIREPNTFWTSCNRCKMQYEYLRVYLNHNILCPNCHEPFLAVETTNPTNGHNPSIPWSSSQQKRVPKHRMNSYGQEKKSASNAGSSGLRQKGCAAYSVAVREKAKREREEKLKISRGTEAIQKTNVHKRTSNGVTIGNSTSDQENPVLSSIARPRKRRSISSTKDPEQNDNDRKNCTFLENRNFNSISITGFPAERAFSVSGARMQFKETGNLSRDISFVDIKRMLTQKAKTLVQEKLKEWNAAAPAKSKETEKWKLKQKKLVHEKENEHVLSHQDKQTKSSETKGVFSIFTGQMHYEKGSSNETCVDSDNKVTEPVSIDVPDPDFHDFDKDRSESSFEPNQVWAMYDDEDGMPRFYALVQKVVSTKPFKIRMSFLNFKTNSEFGPLNWVGTGFAKTSGDFRISRYEMNENINIFSHKVRWEKGPHGVIKILPRKGDSWALYRNWSPDWNELTADDVIHKYDMVEVLDDYNEEQGVTVAPLVKVTGFKTVFRGRDVPEEVKRIPREEMFRFSHQVPCYLLNGLESQKVPQGCLELDPAATPLELLQVITEAKEDMH